MSPRFDVRDHIDPPTSIAIEEDHTMRKTEMRKAET
jgi:hypothetical protein